ncbi:MAG: CvpA family protein [Oscillospiraceae bacterium]|nr:CvpA family protein [Oscillospiraceae bacterium]
MSSYLIDGLIIAALGFFVWRGYRRGLILTLMGLAAIFLAFFGARLLAEHLAPPIANLLQPPIQQAIEDVLPETSTLSVRTAAASLPAVSLNLDQAAVSTAVASDQAADQRTLQDILDALGESELFAGLQGLLKEAIEADKVKVVTTAVAAVSRYLAELIATAAVFILAFLGILLACFLLGHALDLAFRLPVLSQFNRLGGALCGLIKGCIFVMLAVWTLRLGGVLTADNTGPVAAVMTIQGLSSLLQSLVG